MFWVLGSGFWVKKKWSGGVMEYWGKDSGSGFRGSGFWVQGSGFWVLG